MAQPLSLKQRESRAGLGLISPTLLIVVAVVVLPMIWTFLLSFQRVRLANLRRAGINGDYTLRNFQRVLSSDGFWSSLWTTVVYTVLATTLSIAVGLVAALVLRQSFRGRTPVRALMLLPYVAPVVAVTFVWQTMLNPQNGIVNSWGQRLLGWEEGVPFLSSPSTSVGLFGIDVSVPLALFTVIAFEIWRYFPFAFLFLLARLQAVPGELEEASRVDGATPLQRFRYILLPQLLPVIGLLAMLRFIFTFNKFDDIYLLTGGGAGTEVVSVRVYDYLTAQKDVGASAAQAVVLGLILVVFIAVYLRMSSRHGEA